MTVYLPPEGVTLFGTEPTHSLGDSTSAEKSDLKDSPFRYKI